MILNAFLVMVLVAALTVSLAFIFGRHQEGGTLELTKGVELCISALIILFGFSTALSVNTAQSELDDARTASLTEAGAMKDAFFASQGLKTQDRTFVRRGLERYAKGVIQKEWPAMRHGKIDPGTLRVLDDLRLTVYQMGTSNDFQRAAKSELSAHLQDVYVARRDRMAEKNENVPGPVLGLMIGTGATILLVLAITSSPRNLLHYFLLASAASSLGYMMYLVMALNHPYAGWISVGPDAFIDTLQRFHQVGILHG